MIDFQLMSTKTEIGTKFGDPPPSNDYHVKVKLDISKATVFYFLIFFTYFTKQLAVNSHWILPKYKSNLKWTCRLQHSIPFCNDWFFILSLASKVSTTYSFMKDQLSRIFIDCTPPFSCQVQTRMDQLLHQRLWSFSTGMKSECLSSFFAPGPKIWQLFVQTCHNLSPLELMFHKLCKYICNSDLANINGMSWKVEIYVYVAGSFVLVKSKLQVICHF